ncbi:hypothetical protein WH95_01320 [Kiloniella litopenaei]|uniref:Uncharacterized protein n=1 Tax=Kiloniella litopenaei TaxID=1549748 RepID=A0A0M2RE85_9PROT|nr:hypothetical protein [Kiloniella litopenaei]KKJ78744.1 hypothetical protein WH95_01320 [Kiloniella litopenaei]
MAYSAKNLSEDLGKEMEHGYRASKVAKLASQIHHNHRRELSRYLDCKLMQLTAMEEGPEFEFSEGEMRHLISELRSH